MKVVLRACVEPAASDTSVVGYANQDEAALCVGEGDGGVLDLNVGDASLELNERTLARERSLELIEAHRHRIRRLIARVEEGKCQSSIRTLAVLRTLA